MFTWWNVSKKTSSDYKSRYRPVLECLEQRETPAVAINVGPTVNVSQAIGNQINQSVAINPANPQQVVAVSDVEDITGDGGDDPGIFEAFSIDGGQTWNAQYLFTDPTSIDQAAGPVRATFDRFGNLFLVFTTTTLDIAVAFSVDGGQTFFSQVLTADGLNGQASIASGPANRPDLASVWISYRVNNDTTLGIPPHIETAYAWTAGLGLISPFTAPVFVPGSDAANGNHNDISVGAKGKVIVTYESGAGPAAGPSTLWANVDPDGLGFAGWGPRRLISNSNVGIDRRIPANGLTARIDAAPSVAVSYGAKFHRGRIYFVYADAPNVTSNDINIFMRFSDNDGVSWSAPVRVNNDTTGRSQFLPAVAVDPTTGIVAVAWYDARNSGTNSITQVFAAISDDGGATFGSQFPVSNDRIDAAASFPPATGAVSSGVGFFNQISFFGGNLQINWSDNSATLPGNPDLFHMDVATARVRVGRLLRVRVIFPARWRLIDAVNGLFAGRLTIINNSRFDLTGPIKVTINLPDPSLSFLAPPNTQSGTTVTFTINANLPRHVPLRVAAILSNPLRVKLPTSLIGFATSVV
jgi:hypothetical protein